MAYTRYSIHAVARKNYLVAILVFSRLNGRAIGTVLRQSVVVVVVVCLYAMHCS